uniref:Rab GTPase-activating protein 1-like n=1 Tax=Scophthalmus maximus TaxID=52904 RepID=A0A8D3D1Z9_SCOMX
MMEEVSTMMAYDAHVMEQMSEEEILACLVAETGPKFTVPTKKAKLRESRLQIMDPEEDALDEYLKENRRLQQTSLRLEQENDNLAHRLITSKVALRNALDKAEDKVDDLTKDLLQTRRRLQATEEEKAGKEEEAAMLKEMFRRELEKAEQQVRRSSGIIADYKQICSQLANRLERQQTAHTEELESLKRAVQACSRCQRTVDADEPPAAARASPEAAARTEGPGTADAGRREDSAGPTRAEQTREDQEKESLRAQTRELEQDLAQTKLQMVEAKCRIQVSVGFVTWRTRETQGPETSEVHVLLLPFSHTCPRHALTGAGAPEGNPGRPDARREGQLDQQGLHLPAHIRRRGDQRRRLAQGRRSSGAGPEPPRRREAAVASQRQWRARVTPELCATPRTD